MASSGRVRIKVIKSALEESLPGCCWKEAQHHWHILPPGGGPAYHLPKGEHGKKWRAEIERGHIRRLARQFGILEKMEKHIPGL
ncbi:MAG TPA: hypothetical protein ENJ16_03035 [Planctomycetaceae bacterium]|nr:hypothetical protein [Planctomycetaceae bacterium]